MLPPNESLPPIGRRYRVGNRELFLHQSGGGQPSIVFLPGAGGVGLSYFTIQQEAARLGTAVVYDRGGTGWSDDLDLPRSARSVVEELESLLRVVALPAPYLLVGHSLGGVYARRFAQLYPDQVAGLLLLDPANENYSSYLSGAAREQEQAWKKAPMPDLTPEMIEMFRPILMQMYATSPEEIRAALMDRHLHPSRASVGLKEGRNIDEVYDEVRNGGPLPAVPVIVYTALGIDDSQRVFSTEEVIRGQNQAKLAAANAFAASVAEAENRVLDDASHTMLHVQRPDAVMQGLRDLLARRRQPEPALRG